MWKARVEGRQKRAPAAKSVLCVGSGGGPPAHNFVRESFRPGLSQEPLHITSQPQSDESCILFSYQDEADHSASVEGHFRQISIVPKTLFLILDGIFMSYGMCLEKIWLVFTHNSHFMAH